MKIISKKCENLSEILNFKNISCNLGENLKELKQTKNIIILGNFDGVHKGHKAIFNEAIEKAKKNGYKTVIYTFREYPQNKSKNITTSSEKLYLLNECEIDYIYLDEFEDVRNFNPEEFVEKVLVNILNVKEIFCGFNFTFGKNKSGNIKTLDNILKEKYNKDIVLNVHSPVLDIYNEVISSTRIREFIEKTDLLKAKELLGYNMIIMGEVIHGKKLGRTLGYPTANLHFKDKIYPSFGVYGAYIHVEGENSIYHGVINIGKNPTVDFTGLTVEAHIFDFDKDIYGKVIMIEILEKISDEMKLKSLEELVEKIKNDALIWRKKINEKYYDTSKNR
ncbi:MAG: bifunctional riboflavin kinase/FAD synthetase [Leptotrichiaceae bacterium]|nr:bifunctional riboflavin kinase/FAD synthetase [Leptotrichiaceae bacterium]MBP9630034.1 bifunctional riboflavin kinase/FAD synthetase [Leptotrichiaceae bacterium]